MSKNIPAMISAMVRFTHHTMPAMRKKVACPLFLPKIAVIRSLITVIGILIAVIFLTIFFLSAFGGPVFAEGRRWQS